MAVRVRAALTALAVLAACTPPSEVPGVGDEPLAWSDVRRDGLGDARLAVLVSPYEPKWNGPGRLGLVDADGATRFVDLRMNPDATLGGRPGTVCAATATTTVAIGEDGGRRRLVSDAGRYGLSTRVREDGTCVRFVANGGTAVHWEQDGRARGTTTYEFGDLVGIAAGAAWVIGTEDASPDATYQLIRVDLATGRTSTAAKWSNAFRRDPDGRLIAGDQRASDLFWHDGRLHHLLEVRAARGTDEWEPIRPGVESEVHLVSIDPRTGRRESTPLFVTSAGLSAGTSGDEEAIALELRDGTLYAGSIFTTNGDGDLLAVDVATRSVRLAGRLSERAREADGVAAAWHGSRLALVLREGTRAVAEDYDLKTGALTRTTPLRGLDGVLTRDTYVSGVAIVG